MYKFTFRLICIVRILYVSEVHCMCNICACVYIYTRHECIHTHHEYVHTHHTYIFIQKYAPYIILYVSEVHSICDICICVCIYTHHEYIFIHIYAPYIYMYTYSSYIHDMSHSICIQYIWYIAFNISEVHLSAPVICTISHLICSNLP